ncbi:hypothetical protein HYU06_03585 [Candidatus Woesearchaeota archaeon]|nr:hypothetical protein [Candidatus Woesearchaeota archaeon]
MVVFSESNYHPMDRDYSTSGNSSVDLDSAPQMAIEQPINSEPNPITIADVGQSVTEGNRFGMFRQSINAAIRIGARKIELQTQMGGGAEPVGAESYGKASREELREIARANQIEFQAVHAPTQIGNLSGFVPRQGGAGDFSDEHRKAAIEEIKKAIDFSADVAQGGAVVVHTGEYHRPLSEQKWAKEYDQSGKERYKFLSYKEEPERAVLYMVDKRNGRVIGDVRKNQTVREPIFLTAGEEDKDTGINFSKYIGEWDDRKYKRTNNGYIEQGDLLDRNGKWLDPEDENDLFQRVPKYNPDGTRFESRELTWKDFQERAEKYNNRHKNDISDRKLYERTPEEEFFRTQLQTQILQQRGSSLFHGRYYEEERDAWKKLQEALEFYKELESKMPEEDVWKIAKEDHSRRFGDPRFIPSEFKKPTDLLQKSIRELELEMKYTREASAAADAQADSQLDNLRNIEPISRYAKDQSMKSYAEVAIHAMQQSERQEITRPIFVAPENIFPEMGYGSHPEELIELVQDARSKMVQFLTSPKIDNPHGKRYTLDEAKNAASEEFKQKYGQSFGKEEHEKYQIDERSNQIVGRMKQETNPWFQPGMTKEQATKEAAEHIRATFDTQHLSMWRQHFQPIYVQGEGRIETKQETDGRFREWYMEQVEKMEKNKIIGHVHLVDSMGSGHHHLPGGQGEWPVIDAATYLKKKGYDITITSEGWGEETISQGRILTEVWKALGSPIYSLQGPTGVGRGGAARWDDVQFSYFGQNRPPYYIFGGYAPSNDWTLFSQVPLE